MSLWVWDVKQKIKNASRVSEGQSSLVLPKIGQKYSKNESDFNVNKILDIVDVAVKKVNNIEETKPKEELRKEEQEKRRAELERKKEEAIKKKQEEDAEREREREREMLEKMLKKK